MTGKHADPAASVRARLLNLAKVQGVDFNQMLVRFALERLLYRLAQSRHAQRFVLKGALLFTVWYDMPHRATRDADLLGIGSSDLHSMAEIFREIAAMDVSDGIKFEANSVSVLTIRKDAAYDGIRVLLQGELAKARCRTQVDIGFGDAVFPPPEESVYPVLLDDLPAPRLRTYSAYTVVAEKVHALAVLGMTNSRLKDYFDLSLLLEREALDAALLANAIEATFARRGTAIPDTLPVGLSDEFGHDPSRQSLWQAFLNKTGLKYEPLAAVVERIRIKVWPALSRSSGSQIGDERPQ